MKDSTLALTGFKFGMYDLALLDIKMPKMDGFQLYRKLKKMDNKLKVCFSTAADLAYYKEAHSDVIKDLGSDCFVAKPD